MTRRTGIVVLAVAALGILLVLPQLGASALWDPWEPRYAQAAREMSDQGEWVVPQYREAPRLVKPPLTYWLIGLSTAAFGIGEAQARLPAALLSVMTATLLAWALARRGRALEGFLAGAVLMTSPQWLLLARFATPDMPLAALLGTALGLAIAGPAVSAGSRQVRTAAVALTLAGAVLVEWPRGLLLPLWAALGWAAVRGGLRARVGLGLLAASYAVAQQLHSAVLNLVTIGAAVLFTIVTLMPADPASRRRVLVGALLVVVIASPWFVAVFQLEPDEASRRLLGYKHALNLGETPGAQSASPLFVLRIVAVGAFPWVAAAVVGLGAIRRDDAARIAAGTLLGGFLFFGLAEAKMGHFYGVLQPPLAVLAAIGLVAALRPASRARWYVPLALVATWSLIRVDPDTLLETATVFRQLGEWAQPALLASAVALAWSLLWVGAIWTGRPAATVATVVPAALLAGALALSAVPALGPRKSLGPAWERYAAERGPAEPLGVWGFAKDSIFYYSDNDVVRLKQPAALETFLAPEGVRYLIAPRDELEGVMSLGEPGSRWERLELEHPTHELLRYRHDSGSRPSESPTRASVATGALGIDRTTLYRSMKRLGIE